METVFVILGVLIALVGGFFTAQASNEEKPVRGGMVSQVFHYIACGAMSAIPAAFLLMLFLTLVTSAQLFRTFFWYVIVSIIVVLASLLVHVIAEPDAPIVAPEPVRELD